MSARFETPILLTALVGILASGALLVAAEPPASDTAGAITVTVNSNTPGTTTAGIQEAIDILPQAGGVVVLPVGVYEVQRTIFMKPFTTLRGCGDGSIIRKSPGLLVPLAEDVSAASTQNYVVVKDASALKPGMGFCVGLDDVLIDRIEGNKVFLKKWAIHYLGVGQWKPSGDLKLEKKAALYNGFPIIRTSRRCVISNLALDGNRDAQRVNGEELYKNENVYPKWWERLRCAPYIGGDSRLEWCRIYNAAGVAVSVGNRGTVIGCDVSGSYQGIHTGGSPYSRVIQNTIHHNEYCGMFLCLGNYGMIISQNHIYENKKAGIGALGLPLDRPGRCGDHFNIISDNVIYRNETAGIESGQGVVGPEDFIITGNIVMNNNQGRNRYMAEHQFPAGIALFNAKRCVIANNRCFDDQDWYPSMLTEPVAAGATNFGKLAAAQFPKGLFVPPLVEEPLHPAYYYDGSNRDPKYMGWGFADFVARIEGGGLAECLRVTHHGNGRLTANTPLIHEYQPGALITPEETQLWGIFVGGPESAENVIANNVCARNQIGGILWSGSNCAVSANVGKIVEMDLNKTLAENVYPFAMMTLPGLAFGEDSRWHLGAGALLDQPGPFGGRTLKLSNPSPTGTVVAIYNEKRDATVLSLKPNTYYRVTALVKSKAKQSDQVCLPKVFLYEFRKDGTSAGTSGYAQPAHDAQFKRPAVAEGVWIKVAAQGRTRGDVTAGQIYCNLEKGMVGEAWVADVTLQELYDGADLPAAPVATQAVLRAVYTPAVAASLPAVDAPRGAAHFVKENGAPAALATQVSAFWDATNVYYRVDCADPDSKNLRRRHADTKTFQFSDDCVAVLIQPNAANPAYYYQFAVSAAGQTFNQVCSNDSSRDKTNFHPDWQARATITPNGWTAWLAIPFAVLCPFAPEPGTVWGVNVGRNAWVDGRCELAAWQPTADWHNVAAFGRLAFVK